MILKCQCGHKYQDEKHGPKMRVHNKMKSSIINQQYRCTVCKRERGVSK